MPFITASCSAARSGDYKKDYQQGKKDGGQDDGGHLEAAQEGAKLVVRACDEGITVREDDVEDRAGSEADHGDAVEDALDHDGGEGGGLGDAFAQAQYVGADKLANAGGEDVVCHVAYDHDVKGLF